MGFIIRKGFDKDLVISNELIDVHSRCGDISVARKLFDGLVKKDAVSWNVMINGYGLNGNGEAALDLFLRMKLSGIRPNGITFSSVRFISLQPFWVGRARPHGIQIYGRTWDSTPNGALCLHGGPPRKNG
jgi:pentatricopeptide repeat protein